ncbi:FtsH protease activity modulator HflK [bacterium]|nr:FtsH protease activity modulator HflK [bacterium]
MKRKGKIFTWLIVITVLLAGYFGTGFYSLKSGQHALVLRFGKYVRTDKTPGVHLRLPIPFEKQIEYNVNKVQTVAIPVDEKEDIERMTGDANLIMVSAVITYEVKDLKYFLFNARDQASMIHAITQQSLTRQLVEMNVDDVMTTGKSNMRVLLKANIQEKLDSLRSGVWIKSVELTDIAPPPEVETAFNKVSDARVEKQEIIKSAEGYANAVVPNARGQGSALISGAEGYAEERLNEARGKVKAFQDIYTEYLKNPSITLKQRYLNTLEVIMNKCDITVDSDPGNSIYYLGKEPKGESK